MTAFYDPRCIHNPDNKGTERLDRLGRSARIILKLHS